MIKSEIIKEFCKLSDKVREEVFHNEIPADCFCSDVMKEEKFQFDNQVMDYIINAVTIKINMDKESSCCGDVVLNTIRCEIRCPINGDRWCCLECGSDQKQCQYRCSPKTQTRLK
jgi:hypothetical protein